MAWGLFVILEAAAFLGTMLLALLVLRVGRTPKLRLLALWLAGQALFYAAMFTVLLLAPDASFTLRASALVRAVVMALPFLLLAFLGTIEVPLARPLRRAPVVALLLAVAGTLIVLGVLRPDVFARAAPIEARASWAPGALRAALLADGAASICGLAIGVQAVRASRRATLERSRAVTLLAGIVLIAAFRGGHEAFMLALDAIDPALHVAYMRTFVGDLLRRDVPLVMTLAGTLVLAYGMLRLQLFDADLRLKLTLERGTIGLVFVAVFLIISQLAQSYLSDSLGWAAGGLAAGLLLIALQPLQRAAERISDAALPHVRDTPAWRDERKAELYRSAVRLAMADHEITRKEEVPLADLATQLGLDPRRALDLRASVERESATAR